MYRAVGGITYLAGVTLIVGAALLAVAALLQVLPGLANGPADFGAVLILAGVGIFLLWLGKY